MANDNTITLNQNVLNLLGLAQSDMTETAQKQLKTIEEQTKARLLVLLGGTAEEIPAALSYIAENVAVIRYNRIGSEGLASHSVEGESMTWPDNDFAPYDDDIQAWLDAQKDPPTKKGRVKFI